uniref:F-box domain-containing protein n=1 Tax=Panagrolaimus sp. PS1159 TaxID=55785 RepID=A0AC35G909_9BILA
MYCRAHNFSNINPPKAYAIVHKCNCPIIPPAYPHPNAVIFDTFKNTAINQHFSLPVPLINYTITKMSAIQLPNLMKACKLLKLHVHKLRGFVLTSLSLQYGYATFFDTQSMSLTITSDNANFANIFKGLKLSGDFFNMFQHRSDVTVASVLLSNVKSCKFQCIEISSQILSLKELDILLGPQVRIFKTNGLAFKDLSMDEGSVERILEKLPNAECLVLKNLNFGQVTSQKLAKLQQKRKIYHFEMSRVPENFDRKHFAEFVMKNISSKAKIIIRFDVEVPKSCRNKFRETLKKTIKNEFEEEKRPTFSVACAEYISV